MNSKTVRLLQKFCIKYNRPYEQYKQAYDIQNSKDKRIVREAMQKAVYGRTTHIETEKVD